MGLLLLLLMMYGGDAAGSRAGTLTSWLDAPGYFLTTYLTPAGSVK